MRLSTKHNADSDAARENRAAMIALLGELETVQAEARAGGGDRYVARHRRRGKLLPRERVELLLDPDSPFLELGATEALDSKYQVGASVVTGVGVVAGVECAIVANDPTVRGGANNPHTLRKMLRALEISHHNRLPLVNLNESAGADLPSQADLFVPGGALFREITRLSASRIPTVSVVFGNATAGGAYVPGVSDYTVFVDGAAHVFLGGPPLVKAATGEDASAEELGGGEMHATVSGLADYLARDEPDALRIAREIVADLNWRKLGPGPSLPADEPAQPAEELLGVASADPRVPFSPIDVLARVLDGSRFDEFKPRYGSALTTGWGSVHGYPVGVLANARGILFSQEAQKAAQFIQLANQKDVPLLFVHNTTGFMVGREYERGGIIKHGALMINAVSNSAVPHVGLIVGASYGAAHYAMAGRAYKPRFLFAWPNARAAVMGPAQLAGVLSNVAKAAAEARGAEFDVEADAKARATIESQIEAEQTALANASRGYVDAIIDPRDTRAALGISLSATHAAPVAGADGFGVFRM